MDEWRVVIGYAFLFLTVMLVAYFVGRSDGKRAEAERRGHRCCLSKEGAAR